MVDFGASWRAPTRLRRGFVSQDGWFRGVLPSASPAWIPVVSASSEAGTRRVAVLATFRRVSARQSTVIPPMPGATYALSMTLRMFSVRIFDQLMPFAFARLTVYSPTFSFCSLPRVSS